MAYLSTGSNAQTKTGEMTFDDAKFKAGTSSSTINPMGTILVDTTSAGNVGGGEDTLMTFDLPADSLSTDGKVIRLTAWGKTGATANVKTIKLHFGATVIRQVGASAINDKDWLILGIVVRTGASAQDAIGTEIVDSVSLNTHSEPAEDTTGAITIKLTGQDNDGVPLDNAVVAQGLMIEFLN